MSFIESAIRETGIQPIDPDDPYSFARQNAIVIAHFALEKNMRILGFEGFIKKDNGSMPLMECIVDFSNSQPSIEVIENILNSPEFQRANVVEFVFQD